MIKSYENRIQKLDRIRNFLNMDENIVNSSPKREMSAEEEQFVIRVAT